MRYSVFLYILFIGFSSFLVSQNTIITGNAKGAEGLKIKLTTFSDYISELPQKIDEYVIDSAGIFLLKTSLNETIYSQLQIEFIKGDLYLEPGKKYNIIIKPYNYYLDENESPFLISKTLEMEINHNDSNDINVIIGKINILFNDFAIKEFKKINPRNNKSKIDSLSVILNQVVAIKNSNYIQNYIRYKIAGMELAGRIKGNKKLYLEYIYKKPVLYNHVEYMYFFNMFYEKFFFNGNHTLKFEDLKRLIEVDKNYAVLLDSLGKDSLVKNEVIRELVFLKGMKELYYLKTIKPENIIDIISRFALRTKFTEHKKISGNLIADFISLQKGSKAPEFKLSDINGKIYTLASFKGKYTYISFFTTWCAGCSYENEAIAELFKKYSDKINFVSIAADKQILNLQYFLNKQKYKWTFLHKGNNVDVLDNYGVKTFPVFILIDPYGNIVSYPALKPGEGIEDIFKQVLSTD